KGLHAVMIQRVQALVSVLSGCGIRVDKSRWLSIEEIRALIKIAYDPDAAEALHAAGGILDADQVMSVSVEEERSHVWTTSGVHRTWWIEDWPRTQVDAGFLTPIVTTGSFPHMVTQIFEPINPWKTESDLKKAEQDAKQIRDLHTRIDRPLGVEHEAREK